MEHSDTFLPIPVHRQTATLSSLVRLQLENVGNTEDDCSFGQKMRVLTAVKKVVGYGGLPSDKLIKKLNKHLKQCGFTGAELKPSPSTNELELVERPGKTPKVCLARFQLEHMGGQMEVEAPKQRDSRVDAFNPDLWQRELFDVVDKRGSALIIAPTSSGTK